MIFLLLACTPDDVKDDTAADADTDTDADTDADTDSDTDTDSPGDITGSWLSEDDDVSDILVGFGFTSVSATFNSDGTYAVAATNSGGNTFDFTGTFTVGTTTNPGTIVTEQATPTVVTAEGIWQVVGDTLTYEVAQTSPDQGFTPPTPEAGFGSTGGPGVAAGSNVQIYQRQ